MFTLAALCATVLVLLLSHTHAHGVVAGVAVLPIAALMSASLFFVVDQIDDDLAAGLRAVHAASARGEGELRLSRGLFEALIAIGEPPKRFMPPPSPSVGIRSVADLCLTPRLLGQRPITLASIAG